MNWFDVIILIIIIGSSIRGFSSGLIKQLASLAGLILGAIFAGQAASFIFPYLKEIINGEDYFIKPISYLLAFICIMIIFLLLGKILQGIFKAIKLNFINKLAGAFFSTAKWLIIISIIINLLSEFDSKEYILKKDVKENSKTYSKIKNIAPYFIPFLDFAEHSE